MSNDVTKDDSSLIFGIKVAEATFRSNLTNVTIRDFTFTGDIQNSGNKYGTSVLIDQLGDFTLEDCHWTNIVTREGLALVTTQWQDKTFHKTDISKLKIRYNRIQSSPSYCRESNPGC